MSVIWEPIIRKEAIPKNNVIVNQTSDNGHVKHNCGAMCVCAYESLSMKKPINTEKKILPDGSIPWIQLFRNKL
jgi:hypothetical protein